MFMSMVTGEVGNVFHILKNLVGRDYKNRLFLNLHWRRIVWNDELRMWDYESTFKGVIGIIKRHRSLQAVLAIAALGDCAIWTAVITNFLS